MHINNIDIKDSERQRASKEADKYVADILITYPQSGDTATELKTAEPSAVRLIESFRNSVLSSPGAGDVAIYFADFVLHAIGSDSKLTDDQKLLIQSACAVVRRRPLPVLRWANFVLSNLEKPDRIRDVLTACKRSKWMLAERLRKVAIKAGKTFSFSSSPRILVIGYSKTVVGVIRGLFDGFHNQLTILTTDTSSPRTHESYGKLIKGDLESLQLGIEVEVIADEKAAALCRDGQIDIVLSGCKIISRTCEGGFEVITSLTCADLIKTVHGTGVTVVVVAGLYKIWPTRFYKEYKPLALEATSIYGEILNGVLFKDDIDYIITEIGYFNSVEFGKANSTRPFFEADNLEIPCALAAYPNKQEFKRAVRKIDRTLHELTSDDYPLKIHHDTIRWWGNGQLPQSFLKAQALFNEKLKDRIWYEKYKGKYAAVLIRGGKTLIETDSDPNTLMQKAYSMWGYRPIFMGYVTSDRNMISLRPQYTSTSICNSTKKITG